MNRSACRKGRGTGLGGCRWQSAEALARGTCRRLRPGCGSCWAKRTAQCGGARNTSGEHANVQGAYLGGTYDQCAAAACVRAHGKRPRNSRAVWPVAVNCWPNVLTLSGTHNFSFMQLPKSRTAYPVVTYGRLHAGPCHRAAICPLHSSGPWSDSLTHLAAVAAAALLRAAAASKSQRGLREQARAPAHVIAAVTAHRACFVGGRAAYRPRDSSRGTTGPVTAQHCGAVVRP